ncbi:MAG: transglutaminase-like domain-containing protein [bacterium]
MKKVIFLFFIIFVLTGINAKEKTYTISMLGSNIGESIEKWKKYNDISGKCVLQLEAVSTMDIARGGHSLSMKTKSLLKANCHDLFPISIESESSETGSEMNSKAEVQNNFFKGEIVKNNIKETTTFPVPAGTVFFGMIFKKLSENDLLKGGAIQVISEESLALKTVSYQAVKESTGLLKATVNYEGIVLVFFLKKDLVVRSELQGGLVSYQLKEHQFPTENRQKAPFQSTKGDILTGTSILNRGIRVRNPRETNKMSFTVSGSHISEIPETCFQKKMGGSNSIAVDNAPAFCNSPPALQDTQGNIFEDSNNIKIITTAQKITQGAPNKNEKIKRLTNFVFNHIKNKNYNHGNLSASETLEKKAGDCTEHATLLSALLKSVGIPTKMAYGIVLDNNGKFMFHNWNEVYGDFGWMTVDSTFKSSKADAARILLAYGGNDSSAREQVSLAVIKFLNSFEISVTGFSNE